MKAIANWNSIIAAMFVLVGCEMSPNKSEQNFGGGGGYPIGTYSSYFIHYAANRSEKNGCEFTLTPTNPPNGAFREFNTVVSFGLIGLLANRSRYLNIPVYLKAPHMSESSLIIDENDERRNFSYLSSDSPWANETDFTVNWVLTVDTKRDCTDWMELPVLYLEGWYLADM